MDEQHISRKEALERAIKVLEKAEKERREAAEKEAQQDKCADYKALEEKLREANLGWWLTKNELSKLKDQLDSHCEERKKIADIVTLRNP